MNLREGAITMLAILGALTLLFVAMSYGLNHERSSESTTTAGMVANKVANVVKASVACNNPTVTANGTQWAQDGAAVSATVNGGELQVRATAGKRAYAVSQPVWTNCKNAGATMTAPGATGP